MKAVGYRASTGNLISHQHQHMEVIYVYVCVGQCTNHSQMCVYSVYALDVYR